MFNWTVQYCTFVNKNACSFVSMDTPCMEDWSCTDTYVTMFRSQVFQLVELKDMHRLDEGCAQVLPGTCIHIHT